MAMGPEGQAAPEAGGGGASQLVADTNSNLMKLAEMLSSKFPEDAQKLQSVIQGFQAIVEGLGSSPGAPAQENPGVGTTTPEAGAAKVQPTY